MKINWTATDKMPTSGAIGHGIEFLADPPSRKIIACIKGFEWLHGQPEEVTVLIKKPDAVHSTEFLSEMKQHVEKLIVSGGPRGGQLCPGVSILING